MFGLALPVLIAAGIGLTAVLGGGALWSHHAGAKAQEAEDAPIIERWKTQATTEKLANDNVRAELKTIKDSVKTSNDAVDNLCKKPSDTAKAEIATVKLQSAKRERLLESELAAYKQRAAFPSGKSKELQCVAATEVLNGGRDPVWSILGFAPSPSAKGGGLVISK